MSKLNKVARRLKKALGEDASDPTAETLDLIEKHAEEIRDAVENKELSEHFRVKLAIALGLIREVGIHLSDDE